MFERKRKVAVIGALNVDVGGVPEAAFIPGDSIPGRVTVSLGGVGWNIARDCALLGAETAFFSLLGRDGHEAAIRREAAEYGVSLRGCRWTEEPNNRYLYISGRGGEMVAAVNDMRLCGAMDEAFAEAVLPLTADCGAAAADANLPPETLRRLAKGLTAPLVADCVSAAKCGRLRPILHLVHTLKANRLEAEMLTGCLGPENCARALLEAGVRRAVISLGPEGVLCAEGAELFRLPAVCLAPKDVTGAGDGLTAALTAGLAMGLSMEECADLGMRAAGIILGSPGAVTKELAALAPQ